MSSIWGFLLQTLSASLVAALLLLVKWLLSDKLSPRWQYGVWGILALRIVLPVWSMNRYILLPIPLWLETLKGITEGSITSVYSSAYVPIRVRFPLPWISGRPESVTDWIFIVYIFGVLLVLMWYLFSYVRLRLLLYRGNQVSDDIQRKMDITCKEYSLRPCRAVAIAGLPSAFVCGIFRPVLAIPADAEIDEKVLLHELLHLKCFDASQSVIWCILRALNWCNPFLQYVFNRIGNDMETLCDQRVLERLEGEQRREYGNILLSMANEKYPRAPGTTSLSNGGKNIKRRITSIARFKKYPQGMALVSICTAIVLLCSSLFGSYAQSLELSDAGSNIDWAFATAMAKARTTRCTTMAAALDTYAKGLMYENGVYIAAASPLSSHEALAEKMIYSSNNEGWVYYHLENGLEGIDQSGYWVYNLKELSENSCEALLVFSGSALRAVNSTGYQYDENGNLISCAIAYPVKVRYEDAWVVTEDGEAQVYPGVSQFDIQYGHSLLPYLTEYWADGQSGTVTARVQAIYTVNNAVSSNDGFDFFGTSTFFDDKIKLNAEFESCSLSTYFNYIFDGSVEERKTIKSVGILAIEIENLDIPPDFPNTTPNGDGGGSSNNGSSWSSSTISDDWDGTLRNGGGNTYYDIGNKPVALPVGYAARIFWNGALQETFILKEVAPDGTTTAG